MQKLSPTKCAVQPSNSSDKLQALNGTTCAANSAEDIIFGGVGIEPLHGNIDGDFAFSSSNRYGLDSLPKADVLAGKLLADNSAALIFVDSQNWQMSPDGIPFQNADDAELQNQASAELTAFKSFNFAGDNNAENSQAAASEFAGDASDANAPEFAEQNSAANNGKTKSKANFASFLAKAQNALSSGTRRANTQKSASRNTGEKDNA